MFLQNLSSRYPSSRRAFLYICPPIDIQPRSRCRNRRYTIHSCVIAGALSSRVCSPSLPGPSGIPGPRYTGSIARKQRVSGAYLPSRPSRPSRCRVPRKRNTVSDIRFKKETGSVRVAGFVYLESNRSGRSLSSTVGDCLPLGPFNGRIGFE